MEDLPSLLRRETADLHAAVETATGLPGSIRSRVDYRTLLYRLHGFHRAAEVSLADSQWAQAWAVLDIDLRRFRRSHLIEKDLQDMQASPPVDASPITGISCFPGMLGCLYVLEGSALGGRVIGPAIRSSIGEVPTRFFESGDRGHPSPWRTLTEALQRFDGGADGSSLVVDGARRTFLSFEMHVAMPRQD
ncbi:hypothetical protein E3T55_11255 [Cryobacterium frigoriphilum]|uniref:Heme oxygenase n=1 Tax=Cryobacterium frigoriphilum TaxID=1259150 RepID=A0A4V3IR14_9MICO|nr:biliverdin-producing heme oxygenase [Cryobacterium frigoriphilum]TFD49643.1 hypothetical protein E3T55_11255 [Cryobacterium frigoriphilum]